MKGNKPMITGSCLCQAVKYELSKPPEEMSNCHCSMCRKSHGAPFATFARVKASTLRFATGEEQLVRYRSSHPVQRCFCPICGSPIVFLFDGMPDAAWIAAGTLDQDPGVKPTSHIFVDSKAPWHDITDNLPQHAEYPQEA